MSLQTLLFKKYLFYWISFPIFPNPWSRNPARFEVDPHSQLGYVKGGMFAKIQRRGWTPAVTLQEGAICYNSGGLGLHRQHFITTILLFSDILCIQEHFLLDSGDRKNSNTHKLMFDQFTADLFNVIAYILILSKIWYFTESTCLKTINKVLIMF